MARVVLIPRITEGDSGCRVEIVELGMSAGMSTRDEAIAVINTLLLDHCEVLVRRGGASRTTPTQLAFAQSIVDHGFELKIPGDHE